MSDNDYAARLLNKIATADKMAGKDRLVVGRHRVALLSLDRRLNRKTKDYRIQASFEVLQSDVYKPGTKASTSFFVERSEFPEYEHDRARTFIDACAACLGDTRGTAAMGGDLLDPGQRGRGIVIDVVVTADLNEDGSPKKGKKGNTYTSETWIPVMQTWDQVAEARVELDKTHGPYRPEGQPVASQVQQPQGGQQGWGQQQGQQTQQTQQGWGQQPQGGQQQNQGGSQQGWGGGGGQQQGGSLLRRGG